MFTDGKTNILGSKNIHIDMTECKKVKRGGTIEDLVISISQRQYKVSIDENTRYKIPFTNTSPYSHQILQSEQHFT